MEQNQKFRLRLNLFDCAVIVIALAVGGLLLWSKMKPADTSADAPSTTAIRYTVCLKRTVEGTGAQVKVGDTLVDNIKNYELGKVVEVRVEEAVAVALNYEDKVYVESPVPGYEDVYITLDSNASYTDTQILVGGGYELRTGEAIYIKGTGFLGSGSVYEIERGEVK